jgi:hypothetical protein
MFHKHKHIHQNTMLIIIKCRIDQIKQDIVMIKDIGKVKDIHNINMKIFVLIKKFKNKWKI